MTIKAADEATQFGFQMFRPCWTSLDPNMHRHRPLVDGCSSHILRLRALGPPQEVPIGLYNQSKAVVVWRRSSPSTFVLATSPPACVRLSVLAGAPARCDAVLISDGSWS